MRVRWLVIVAFVLLLAWPARELDPPLAPTPEPAPDSQPIVVVDKRRVTDDAVRVEIVPAGGALSNLSVLCREPQVIDAACGDGGRGVMRTEELEALAGHGDAIALFYLAQRRHREPHAALALAHRAVVHGYVGALGFMSHLLTKAAQAEPDATRTALAEDAYVHAIAGIMFGFGHYRVNLIGTHIESFPEVPVSARVCEAAARLADRINAERARLGLQPLTIHQDHASVRSMLQDDNGYCR